MALQLFSNTTMAAVSHVIIFLFVWVSSRCARSDVFVVCQVNNRGDPVRVAKVSFYKATPIIQHQCTSGAKTEEKHAVCSTTLGVQHGLYG